MQKNSSAFRRSIRQSFSSRRMLFPLAVATLLGAAGAARAQGTFIWDGGGANNNWQTAANWSTDVAPTPTSALVFAGMTRLIAANDYTANTQFNGIAFAVGAGSFTLSGNAVNLGGDIVNASGSTQTISLALALLQNTNYTLATGLTNSGVISGGFGINKTGAGVLTLTGANLYTGSTTIGSGGLTLNFGATGAPASNIISASSALVLGSNTPISATPTTLTLTGKSAVVNTQTFNGTTFQAGNTVITPTATGTGGTMTLNLGAITHNVGVGATTLLNFASGSTSVAVNTTSTVGTQGILGAWARIGTAVGSYNYATVNGSGNIVAATYTTNAASLATAGAAANYLFDATSTNTVSPTAAGTTDASTIQFTDPAARTVDIGAGNILRLGASGGIWRNIPAATLANNTITIQNGTLTAGGAANTAGEIVFTADGSAVGGASTAGADLGLVNIGINVSSVIADNGTSGKVSVTKNGAQTLQLSGANTYTGSTFVQEGRLISTVAGNLGGDVYVTDGAAIAGQVILNPTIAGGTYTNNFNIKGTGPTYKASASSATSGAGGALVLRNGAIVSGTVTLLGASRISGFGGATGVGGTITGQITGNYSLEFGGNGAFALGTITLNNSSATTPNSWTGNTLISSLNGTNTASSFTLLSGGNNQIPDGVGKGNVLIAASNSASPSAPAAGEVTWNLNGFSETINGLNSGGDLYSASKVITGTAASTLTIGNGDANGAFIGNITGAMPVVKIGAGTQSFGSGFNSGTVATQVQASNTYTGGTTINGGKLSLVNTNTSGGTTVATGFNSATGTGAVSLVGENTANPLASTTTLMGTGFSSGMLTVTTGGRIAPGVNTSGPNANFGVAGTISLGNGVGSATSGLTLTNANLDYDLASAVSGTSDRIVTTGALTLSRMNFTFNELTPGVLDTAAAYTLISGATSLGSTPTMYLTLITGSVIQGDYAPTFSFSGNDLLVSFTPVPEPSTWAMGTLLCLFTGGYVLRRRRLNA